MIGGFFSDGKKNSVARVGFFLCFIFGIVLSIWCMVLITMVIWTQLHTAPYTIELPHNFEYIIQLLIIIFSAGIIVKIIQKIIEKNSIETKE